MADPFKDVHSVPRGIAFFLYKKKAICCWFRLSSSRARIDLGLGRVNAYDHLHSIRELQDRETPPWYKSGPFPKRIENFVARQGLQNRSSGWSNKPGRSSPAIDVGLGRVNTRDHLHVI